MDEKRGTNVQVEMRKAVGLGKVRVPQPDGGLDGQLAHQNVVHPAEGELEVDNVVFDKMNVKLFVDALSQFFELANFQLNAGLGEGVVVLDSCENCCQAPVGVGFNTVALFLSEKILDVKVRTVEDVDAFSCVSL